MENSNIYADIAKRTDGDIYIGIVGPVRTGKSTFIKRFMETLVIPNIDSEFRKERAIDELPQSSGGKTIMTTEPKFIPEEAVKINLEGNAELNVRLIDCVGYIVPSSIGYFENEAPRMVMTPWFEDEVPFNMAAEVGTQKVINDHSTIGIVVTTDGSITDIPRDEYAEAEERVITELKDLNKPFVVLLNSVKPNSDATKALAAQMGEKYAVPIIPINCLELDTSNIKDIMKELLFEFPISEIAIDMPKWVNSLEKDHWLKSSVFTAIKNSAMSAQHICDIHAITKKICECEHVTKCSIDNIALGTGAAQISVCLNSDLFYKILGEVTGIDIADESGLMPCMIELSAIKRKYKKVESALLEVEATGYGIVMPDIDELTLEEPVIVKQGGKYGVKLNASAPSIHIKRIKKKCKIHERNNYTQQSKAVYLQHEDNSRSCIVFCLWGINIHKSTKNRVADKRNQSQICYPIFVGC